MRELFCPYCGEWVERCPPPCEVTQCALEGHYHDLKQGGCMAFFQAKLLQWERDAAELATSINPDHLERVLRQISSIAHHTNLRSRLLAQGGLQILKERIPVSLFLLERPSLGVIWGRAIRYSRGIFEWTGVKRG